MKNGVIGKVEKPIAVQNLNKKHNIKEDIKMKYNKKEFKDFLKNNVKDFESINFDAYCEDLENQYDQTGSNCYELSKFESKTNKPELFYY